MAIRRFTWAVALVVAACGPSVGTPRDHGGNGEGTGAPGGSTGSADGPSGPEPTSDTSTSTGPDEPVGPILDVGAPDTGSVPVACGFEMPDFCEPTWPFEDDLSGGPAETSVERHEHSSTVTFSPRYDADYIASFSFEMPCPYDLGAPKAYVDRFEVEAEVTVYVFAKFEFSEVARYPALVDAQFLNACMHLQIHDILVEAMPIDPADGPTFDWPELIRTGYVYAH